MSQTIAQSPRLQALFAHTKQVCFGRYVLEVPAEAELLWGFQNFPGAIITHENEAGRLQELAKAYSQKILAKRKTAEITYFGPGPVANSIQIRSFEDHIAKESGSEEAYTFVTAGPHLFEWVGGKKNVALVKAIRARNNDELPKEPGVCIEDGFVPDSTGQYQEIFSAGIYLPSLPDVSFSVMSNKDASIDGDPGLIERHYQAMGHITPSGVSRLRLGKHTVNGWQGEEVLLHRNGKGGAFVHEFLWNALGTPGDARNPASIDAQLDTGVKANATFMQTSSLSDDEAVALWDKLLSGLKFRVNAPPTATGAPITAHSGEMCPRTGRWQPTLPANHPKAALAASKPAYPLEQGQRMYKMGLADPADEAQVVWVWQGE